MQQNCTIQQNLCKNLVQRSRNIIIKLYNLKKKSYQDLSIIISMYKVVQTDINIVQFNWKMLYNIKSNITGNIFQNTIQNIVNWVVQCVQRCTTLIKKVVQLHIKYL